MTRPLQVTLGTATVLALIAGPIVYAHHHQAQMRNFRVVREGVLYRSGQMSLAGLQRVLHDYGIRTVITLRDAKAPGHRPPDWAEEEYCKRQGLLYVRIPPRPYEDEEKDHAPPVEEGVRKFREVLSDPRNHPVLVHCFAGQHRSGAYCAIYRMEFEHWSNAEALAEMRSCGYVNLDSELDILGYLEDYRPSWRTPAEDPAPVGPPRPAAFKAKKKPRRGKPRRWRSGLVLEPEARH
jgi:protein tyrosine/serine phosphatase